MRRSATAADLPPPAITAEEFAAALATFSPFEPAPRIAVAVSGGADSMALVLLADSWARAQGGSTVALTVDHCLRAESGAEARQVGGWLQARGIEHHTLTWAGSHPERDLQAAARKARYELLETWCREQHVLHLMTAHHRDDQAETLLLRLGRGSGLLGMGAMASCVEHQDLRVLRPLLGMPAERLRTTLTAAGQDWLEDPSNRNPAFARSRVRAGREHLTALDLTVPRLATASFHAGRARVALEAQLEQVLARSLTIDPAGIAVIEPAPLLAAPSELQLRGIGAVLAATGGAEYPPRFERLHRLVEALTEGRLGGGLTLLGCRIVPWRDRWLVYREPAACADPAALTPGEAVRWDGRFVARLPGGARSDMRLGAFRLVDETTRRAVAAAAMATALPRRIWPSLPALWQGGAVVAVPHLGWRREECPDLPEIRYRPRQPLCGAGFVAGQTAGQDHE
ncbi:MAG TPA: tRNA lysidine(34) synthetase TilS [Stellaceae bacterium]|nr:tRNA lysidine(34) synthetase TilS [Stellaceae bacterium]